MAASLGFVERPYLQEITAELLSVGGDICEFCLEEKKGMLNFKSPSNRYLYEHAPLSFFLFFLLLAESIMF